MDNLYENEEVTAKDFERFALALGIDSFDAGIFYQTYYHLNTEGLDTSTESC